MSVLSGRWRAVGLLAVAAVAVLATPARPAVAAPPTGPVTAAVPGIQVVEASTASNSVTPKLISVSCPAGKVLLGTAARTAGFFGGTPEVVLEGVIPVGNAALAQAVEDEDGFAGAWALTVGAVCANPVAGLQVVTSTGVSDSVARKQKIAICPAGKQLTGMGGAVLTGSTPGQVRLESFSALVPFGTVADGANVIAAEDETGVATNWSITTYAICANPLAGMQVVSAASAGGSGGRQLASAACPAGKRLVGAGAFVAIQSGGFGQVGLESLLTSPLPGVGPPTGHIAFGVEDQTGFAGNWTVTAQAICANA